MSELVIQPLGAELVIDLPTPIVLDVSVPIAAELVLVVAQGIPGPPGSGAGDRIVDELPAGSAISGHRVVALAVGVLRYADNQTLDDASLTIGLSLNAAAEGDDVQVLLAGLVTEASFAFVPGLPVFIGTAGHLTQTPPASPAVFSLPIGEAVGATTLNVRLGPAILL